MQIAGHARYEWQVKLCDYVEHGLCLKDRFLLKNVLSKLTRVGCVQSCETARVMGH